jgi:hypothetical protein
MFSKSGPRQGRQQGWHPRWTRGHHPNWHPCCTRGLSLVTVEFRTPMRLASFLPNPFTSLSSSSFSHSSFSSNIKLSTPNFVPDSITPSDLISLHESISKGILPPSSTFYLGMHYRFGLVLNETPHLGFFWNLHFWLVIRIIWHY